MVEVLEVGIIFFGKSDSAEAARLQCISSK